MIRNANRPHSSQEIAPAADRPGAMFDPLHIV
jgi:hypothetical protein